MSTRRLLRGYTSLASAVILGKAIALASEVRLGRSLGPDLLGQYGSVTALLALGLTLSNAGLDVVGTRGVAGSPVDAVWYARGVRTLRLIAGLLVVVAGLSIAFALHANVLSIAPLLMVPVALAFRDDWMLVALGREPEVAMASIVRDLSFFVLILLFARNAPGLFEATACFAGAELAWAAWLQWRISRLRLRHVPIDGTSRVGLLVSGMPIAFSSLLNLGTGRLSTVIANLLAGPTAAGSFYAAQRVLLAFQALIVPIGRVALPLVVGSEGKRGATLQLPALILALLGGVVGLGFFFFPLTILNLLYGRQFTGGASALQCLGLSAFASAACVLPLQLLLGRNREREVALLTGVAAFGNLVVSFLLVPHVGALGAAVGCAVGDTVLLLGAGLVLRRETVRFSINTSAVMLAVGVISVLATSLLPEPNNGVRFAVAAAAFLLTCVALFVQSVRAPALSGARDV